MPSLRCYAPLVKPDGAAEPHSAGRSPEDGDDGDGGDPFGRPRELGSGAFETLPAPVVEPDAIAASAEEVEAAATAWRRATARLQQTGSLQPERLRQAPGARRVGRYELRDPLGQGGCGTVYRAWDPRHEREVALKIVHRADAQARLRFEREIKATARLRHPGVVSLLDSGEQEGQLFIVTELVGAGSLAARIDRDARLPPEEAARVVRDVALAIHYAHGEGVLHRDLKPHNVLVDERGRARVVDFGLAHLEDKARVTASGASLGTPAYMPPEQIDARGFDLDVRSDIYSLGATLYHALTGRPPFDADSLEELLLSVLRTDAEAPSTHDRRVPADLDTICLKCLEKDPERRYADAEHLARDLERFLQNEPVQARRTSGLTRAWRWSRKNPLLAVMSALLVVLSASLVAVVARYVELRRQLPAARPR